MDEDIQFYLDDAKENMSDSIDHLERELTKIRAGKANATILEGITVEYYGTSTPLNQISNISASDARTLVIQPWEKTMIDPIEKTIMKANLGLNPENNGEIIRLNIPPLTEERRKSLVKQVKNEGENAKVSIRNKRREINDEIKKMKKDGFPEDLAKDAEAEVQKLTDFYSKKVDEVLDAKEKDIMTV